MNKEVIKNFLIDRDKTGREIITYQETGKQYYIEYIGTGHTEWGDLNPATGKIEGSYGDKHPGCVKKSESIITEENGFKNIVEDTGSAYGHVDMLHEQWKRDTNWIKEKV